MKTYIESVRLMLHNKTCDGIDCCDNECPFGDDPGCCSVCSNENNNLVPICEIYNNRLIPACKKYLIEYKKKNNL